MMKEMKAEQKVSAVEKKEEKKRLKRRSTDSRRRKEKLSFSLREMSEVTTDSAHIRPNKIYERFLMKGLVKIEKFLKST